MAKQILSTTIRVSPLTKKRIARTLKTSKTLSTPDDLINQLMDDKEDGAKTPFLGRNHKAEGRST